MIVLEFSDLFKLAISFWFTKSKIKNLFSRCLDPQIGWNTFPENYLETLL
jgi:hypothetical protein